MFPASEVRTCDRQSGALLRGGINHRIDKRKFGRESTEGCKRGNQGEMGIGLYPRTKEERPHRETVNEVPDNLIYQLQGREGRETWWSKSLGRVGHFGTRRIVCT